MMKRREFITLFGGAAAWPLAARAQQRVKRVALLLEVDENDAEWQGRLMLLRGALQNLGWTEGRNLQIDVEWTPIRSSDFVPRL